MFLTSVDDCPRAGSLDSDLVSTRGTLRAFERVVTTVVVPQTWEVIRYKQ